MSSDAGSVPTKKRKRFPVPRLRRRKQVVPTMSMMEHLTELRRRLVVALIGFLAVSVVAFIYFEPITNLLLRPLCSLPADKLGPNGCDLFFTSAMDPISVRLKVTAVAGLVLSAPLWLYQVWAFIVPGLTNKEKRYAFPFVISSVLLFAIGASFAYLTLATALNFLIGFAGDNLAPLLTAQEYLNFVSLIIIVFGIVFELPLLVFFLGLAGVVDVDQLRGARRMVIVGVTLLAAVVTPSQDPYTMLAMALPIYLFYELAILGLRLVRRRKDRNA